VDNAGNIYILDSGNSRVQKFDPKGRYLATIGRKGQGPAEFDSPGSLDIDANGLIYVLDSARKKIVILTPEGKEHKVISTAKLNVSRVCLLKSGSLVASVRVSFREPGAPKEKSLPKLAKLIDSQGNSQKEFAEPEDYGDADTNATANLFGFTVDGEDHILLSFGFQNRIDKYSPDGRLQWKSDRELNYSTKLIERAKHEVTKTGEKFMAAKMNRVCSGVAADDKGRIWVVTLNRQIKKEEEVSLVISHGPSGSTRKFVGNTDLQTTDMFKLEIFAPDGVLLGEIPVTQFVDGMHIAKGRLFLLDRDRGVKFYEYRIIER
jgi:sugar lactone lactonase YvrE